MLVSANTSTSVIVCVSCENYRKKPTDYMETFYHCVFDNAKVIRSCIGRVKGSTLRVDEVMLKGKCSKFKKNK